MSYDMECKINVPSAVKNLKCRWRIRKRKLMICFLDQSRDHIMRYFPKEASKKTQKKKASKKPKKIRDAKNGNDGWDDYSDEEIIVAENKTEEVEERITTIDSNLAVFEIDDWSNFKFIE